jgi:hypothetical protein
MMTLRTDPPRLHVQVLVSGGSLLAIKVDDFFEMVGLNSQRACAFGLLLRVLSHGRALLDVLLAHSGLVQAMRITMATCSPLALAYSCHTYTVNPC